MTTDQIAAARQMAREVRDRIGMTTTDEQFLAAAVLALTDYVGLLERSLNILAEGK